MLLQREGPLVHDAGRVPQAREDVVDGELRVVADHPRGGEPLGEQAEDGRDRDAGAAHAGHPTDVSWSIAMRFVVTPR